MEKLTYIFALFFGLGLGFYLYRVYRPGELSRLEVRPSPLMTTMERRVISMIEKAVPDARVHAQVSMGALMKPAKGLSRSDWFKTFYKFCSKRVDFVVENPANGEILLIVELDDSSHNRRNDKDRDRLTAKAGYTTVRLPAGERPTHKSVAHHINRALERKQMVKPAFA